MPRAQRVHCTHASNSKGHLKTERQFDFYFCMILVRCVNRSFFFLLCNPRAKKVLVTTPISTWYPAYSFWVGYLLLCASFCLGFFFQSSWYERIHLYLIKVILCWWVQNDCLKARRSILTCLFSIIFEEVALLLKLSTKSHPILILDQ